MDKFTFMESMNSWGGSVILASQSSEERINERLRDFIDSWIGSDRKPEIPDFEWLSEDNISLLEMINGELPKEYHIDYMPDDPGTIVIAKQEWWEGVD